MLLGIKLMMLRMVLKICVDDCVDNGVDDVVDDSSVCADKHLTHLFQWVDCHLTQKCKQNKHVVGDKDYDGDNGVDDGVKDSVDNAVDKSDDGADKHLTHLSQGVDCHLTQKCKQNKHVVGGKDNGVDNGIEDGVDNGVDDGVECGDDGVDKLFTHLSQGVDCHLTWRCKQSNHVLVEKDNDVEDDVDNGVEEGDDNSVDNGDDSADKHLTHLSQGFDCHLTWGSE
jgi:hypothetical protein